MTLLVPDTRPEMCAISSVAEFDQVPGGQRRAEQVVVGHGIHPRQVDVAPAHVIVGTTLAISAMTGEFAWVPARMNPSASSSRKPRSTESSIRRSRRPPPLSTRCLPSVSRTEMRPSRRSKNQGWRTSLRSTPMARLRPAQGRAAALGRSRAAGLRRPAGGPLRRPEHGEIQGSGGPGWAGGVGRGGSRRPTSGLQQGGGTARSIARPGSGAGACRRWLIQSSTRSRTR